MSGKSTQSDRLQSIVIDNDRRRYSIRVLDPKGKPLIGAEVRCSLEQQTGTVHESGKTESQGEFRFGAASGALADIYISPPFQFARNGVRSIAAKSLRNIPIPEEVRLEWAAILSIRLSETLPTLGNGSWKIRLARSDAPRVELMIRSYVDDVLCFHLPAERPRSYELRVAPRSSKWKRGAIEGISLGQVTGPFDVDREVLLEITDKKSEEIKRLILDFDRAE